MPYVDKASRERLFSPSSALGADIRTPGELNFVITRLCMKFLHSKEKIGYAEYNEVIGVLESAKQEFYRRCVAVYEDKKKKENGDVFGDAESV
jgi:hypothetical protein